MLVREAALRTSRAFEVTQNVIGIEHLFLVRLTDTTWRDEAPRHCRHPTLCYLIR